MNIVIVSNNKPINKTIIKPNMSLRKAQSASFLVPEGSKYMKSSYRQKGSEVKGSLYRGSTSNAFTKKTIGSIPSKFETVLYPQNNATKKGFGSNGFRFTAQVSENPGPGTYIDPVNSSHSSLKLSSDSYSRKGYGNGFISSSDRFKIDNYQPYQIPGPGAYKQPQLVPVTNKKTIGTAFEQGTVSEKYKSKLSPVFNEPIGKRKTEKPTNILGPGSYEIPRTLINQLEYRNTCAFKAGETRFNLAKSAVLQPGPGQYEMDLEGFKRINTQGGLHGDRTSANFKASAGAKRVKVNLYDPFENVEGEEKRTPGPGQYAEDQHVIYKKQLSAISKSSMFAQHDILDRFGKPKVEVKSALEKLTPGPGQYYNWELKERKGEDAIKIRNGAASAFKSEVMRGTYLGKKPGPGPAFYKVRSKVVKDTKNINPERGWI